MDREGGGEIGREERSRDKFTFTDLTMDRLTIGLQG